MGAKGAVKPSGDRRRNPEDHGLDMALIAKMRNLPRRVAAGNLGTFFVYLTVLLLVFIAHSSGISVLQRQKFDQDEFQHLHSAWYISKGFLPYRDFFQHHTPLYYFLLAPFFQFFNVETNGADSIAFLYFSRSLMWLLSGVILGCTFWLGKLWKNTFVGCIAVLLLVTTQAYWTKSLEIRPDPLAVAFWLLHLILIIRDVSPHRQGYEKRRMFAWSGVFLALSFLALQKIVYAFPGLAVCISWYLWSPSAPADRSVRYANFACQLVGFIVPIVSILTYFYLVGGLSEFIRYNFLFNLGLRGLSTYAGLYQL